MPIIASSGGDFELAPEGLHSGVCVDVIDLGMEDSDWGVRHMVQLRWQIEAIRQDGKRHLLYRKLTLSLNERATLRQVLETWRGKRFTADELKGFDLEKLIGANCQLQIIHTTKEDGRTFANVNAVLPPMKGADKLLALEYSRDSYGKVGKELETVFNPEEDIPF